MKFLLVLLVVLGAVWIWRRNRADSPPEQPAPPPAAAPAPTPPPPTAMVACRHCGLHLPAADAVTGQQGLYCSQAHRQQHEG